MIDKRLNYGRHHIENFLKQYGEYKVVLDLGAGQGEDLMYAKSLRNDVSLHAVESYPPYISTLEKKD